MSSQGVSLQAMARNQGLPEGSSYSGAAKAAAFQERLRQQRSRDAITVQNEHDVSSPSPSSACCVMSGSMARWLLLRTSVTNSVKLFSRKPSFSFSVCRWLAICSRADCCLDVST